MGAEARLAELKLELPPAPKPVATYLTAVRLGDLLYVSGHGPLRSDGTLHVGKLHLELIEANIHSDDATVIWIAALGVLMAGDTMEDTVTYVGEPQNFDIHLQDLERLWALKPTHILPNHGDPEIIALGGYEKTFIRATQQYIRMLMRCVDDPELRTRELADIISGPLEAGWVNLFAPYEGVHRQNIENVLAAKLN